MLGFSWVIEGELAGMGRPGVLASGLSEDLGFLVREGVGAVVSLTEAPLDEAAVKASGLEAFHLPVPDMTPPSPEDIDRFVAFLDTSCEAGRPVAVHCAMGRGRTGTMLACALVHRGTGAREAIRQVREARPGSIETRAQEDAVEAYARRRERAVP